VRAASRRVVLRRVKEVPGKVMGWLFFKR